MMYKAMIAIAIVCICMTGTGFRHSDRRSFMGGDHGTTALVVINGVIMNPVSFTTGAINTINGVEYIR